MQKDLHYPFQKRLYLSVATHRVYFEWKWNHRNLSSYMENAAGLYQRWWLVEILTTSAVKNRQLTASLSTTLGIIHKLLVVICAVYCNAFPCNSCTQSCSCLVSLQYHLCRGRSEVSQWHSWKNKQVLLLQEFQFTLKFSFLPFFVAFFQIIIYWFTAKNEIWN